MIFAESYLKEGVVHSGAGREPCSVIGFVKREREKGKREAE